MADQPGFFGRIAARVDAIVRAARGPETSRLADVPGVAHYGYKPSREQKLLDNWGVYSSRVSPSAGPSRTRWGLWPADNLTPEVIIGAQRQAVQSGIPQLWVELIDQLYSRDGHYSSCANQRVSDVVKGTWRLTRRGTDDGSTAMRNFVTAAYDQCARWNDGMGWLLFSNLYGFNAVEVEWFEDEITFEGPNGESIGPVPVALPRRLHNVHPKHFRFDMESDDPLFWIGDGHQPLPLGKFIFLDGDGLHPIKVRRGHAWQCVWYSLFRSIGWSAWGTHVERFSLPTPIIKYDGDVAQYNEYKSAYEDILNTLGQGKGVIVPRNGAEFQIEPPPQGGRSNDPASALSDACDAGQSIRVLGATLTNKIGNVGSFAASSTHVEAKYALEEGDARRLWERVDEQLTDPLIRFNAEALSIALAAHGYRYTPMELVRRAPRGKHRVPRESDPIVEMQVADYAVNKLSLPLSQEGMLDRIDFPRATSDKDRVKGEPQTVSKGGALVTNAESAEKPAVNVDTAAEKTADAAVKTASQAATEKSSGAKQEPATKAKESPAGDEEK